MDVDSSATELGSGLGLAGGVGRPEEGEATAVNLHVDNPPMSMSEPVANSEGGRTGGRAESQEYMGTDSGWYVGSNRITWKRQISFGQRLKGDIHFFRYPLEVPLAYH